LLCGRPHKGHFSTKTRRYSTTLGCLRSARQRWRTAHTLAAHRLDPASSVLRLSVEDLDDLQTLDHDDDTVLVVGHWRYTGRGYSPGEAIYAATIAADLAESRRLWRQALDDRREAS
jgi:hypothetical protein